MAKAAKTDDKTLELIKEVKRQKDEIAKIEKPNWTTNLSFTYIEGKMNDAVNIHVESNVKNLIGMAAFLMDKEASYEKAAIVLGVVEAPKFTWNGFSVEDWNKDIKMRIQKIQIATKKKKLESLESRLNAIITPEKRRELELQAIEEEMAG